MKHFSSAKIRSITLIIITFLNLSLFFSGAYSLRVFADKTTSEKIKDAEALQKDTEEKLGQTEDKVEDLKNTQSALQKSLTGLNNELSQVSDKISQIEDATTKKEDEIAGLEADIKDAEELMASQYQYLKARIRILYERGEENLLTIFLQTSSFADFLNRAEYISQVNQYDQMVLKRYSELVEDTKRKKEELEQDREELEDLREDAKVEQSKVQTLVNNTKNSITAYAGEISVAEAQALEYEAKLISAKNTISSLKEQLKKEEELARLSQQMKKRSLKEVTVGGGEKELLAALIQCEAGGEPWAGKIAVGAVVMNRVMSGAFPNTITGVIYQSGQFQPVESGRLAIVLSQGANAECRKAAEQAMNGANNIGECLFFRTIVPGIKGTIIGHHVFYLYWTGKYSGYGTADETLETAKKPEDEESESEESSDSEDTESDSRDDSDSDDDDDDDDDGEASRHRDSEDDSDSSDDADQDSDKTSSEEKNTSSAEEASSDESSSGSAEDDKSSEEKNSGSAENTSSDEDSN